MFYLLFNIQSLLNIDPIKCWLIIQYLNAVASLNTTLLQTDDIDRTQQFHFLPKVHKDTVFPQEDQLSLALGDLHRKISQFVDLFINPSVPTIKSYTRDSTCIINILNGITDLPNNAILSTLDVNSLYTNIIYHEGIQQVLAIHRVPTEIQHNSYMMETP